MSHILDSESRVLVFSVDPDDPMTQPSHGQDGSCWKRSTGDPRPGERSHNQQTIINAIKNGIPAVLFCLKIIYLRMATVMASGDVAHGQMTSGFKP